MLIKPDFCKSCVGWNWAPKGQGYVPASGSGENGVLIVAEAAGENELNEGMPLIGKAGYYTFQNLQRVGIEREGFKVHNVLSCRPPENKLVKMSYESDAISHCSPLLDATIREMQDLCKESGKTFVILTLGRTAFKRIMGLDDKSPIMRHDYLNYPFKNEKYNAIVIACDHPSYLMRGNNHLLPPFQYGFQRAIEIARDGIEFHKSNYLRDPDPQTFAQWVRDYKNIATSSPEDTYLAFDIETPYKVGLDEAEVVREDDEDYTILRCSFSYVPGIAISVPWTSIYLSSLEDIFSTPFIKVGWNSETYDLPRIRNKTPVNGPCIDGMLCWHVLNSSLPKGLGYVTPFYAKNVGVWKYKSDSDPAGYNCLNADSRLVDWEGNTHKIEDVVRTKNPLILRGMDENENSIPVKIINWHKQLVKGQKWLKIFAEATRQPIICTPDHKIWTAGGWREAKDLKIGSYIKSSRVGNTELIHGMLLGDSSVTERGRLSIGHSIKQAEYFHLKCKNVDATKFNEVIGGYGSQCLTADALIPKFWRKSFYPGGVKRFIPPFSNAALAIWYLDDGCLAKGKTPRIATYFSNNDEAYYWLADKYGSASKYNIQPKGFVTAIKNAKDFFNDIAEYVPTCMEYKLPLEYRGRYNSWLDSPKPQDTIVTDIKDYIPKFKGKGSGRYCVTIDHPTHRFMTLGGLVKNCQDSDMTLINFIGIKRDLINNDQWKIFDRHVVKLNEVLGYMSGKGVLRDEDLRSKSEIKLQKLLDDVEAKMEETIPIEARKVKIYKKTPKDLNGLIQIERMGKVKRCTTCGLVNPKKAHFKETSKKKKALGLDNVCELSEITISDEMVKLWAKPLEFKVSKVGLSNYQKALKHQAVLSRKEKKVTFDEQAIIKLAKTYPNDPLYPRILEHREYQKLLSTYIGISYDGGLVRGGMPIGRDGRIHTTYSHNPSTLRLASQQPNLQNLPRPSKNKENLGNIIRNLVIAGPDQIFTARDYSGIEAVLVGYFASAPNYIRLAKIDVHSFYTAYALNQLDGRVSSNDLPLLSWDNNKLIKRLSEIKEEFNSDRNELYKHLVHGANFYQGAKGAAEKINKETGKLFKTSLVQRVMDIYFELFPEIRKWHQTTWLQAEKDGFLRNPFGYVHRFNKVYDYEKIGGRWQKKPGPDANKAVAFLPQSTAAGIIKEAMLRLYFNRFDAAGQYLRLQVHDELLLESPIDKLQDIEHIVKVEMERPIIEMSLPASWGMGEYLQIFTEGKRGSPWGSMKGYEDKGYLV